MDRDTKFRLAVFVSVAAVCTIGILSQPKRTVEKTPDSNDEKPSMPVRDNQFNPPRSIREQWEMMSKGDQIELIRMIVEAETPGFPEYAHDLLVASGMRNMDSTLDQDREELKTLEDYVSLSFQLQKGSITWHLDHPEDPIVVW